MPKVLSPCDRMAPRLEVNELEKSCCGAMGALICDMEKSLDEAPWVGKSMCVRVREKSFGAVRGALG